MPTSALELAPRIINLIETIPHDRILDVGPGFGKYGLLLREYLNVKPTALHAVELWEPYITFMMRSIYDMVFAGDATEWREEQLWNYDVVLMVDVIEHMEQIPALDLLARIRGRVVISTPEVFFEQGGPDSGLPDTEIHRSHWTLDDFDRTGRMDFGRIEQGGVVVRLAPSKQ